MKQDRKDTAYNFTVDDFNTYYVTEKNVLVHNCGSRNQNRQIEALRNGQDIRVNSAEQARSILNNMPELRAGPGGRVMPGLRDRRNTYRGDLINTQNPTSSQIHPTGRHRNQPHYNIELIDSNGIRQKPAIFIDG